MNQFETWKTWLMIILTYRSLHEKVGARRYCIVPSFSQYITGRTCDWVKNRSET